MSQVSELERVTQNRVIDLLKAQGYSYLGDLTKLSNQNVREDDFSFSDCHLLHYIARVDDMYKAIHFL